MFNNVAAKKCIFVSKLTGPHQTGSISLLIFASLYRRTRKTVTNHKTCY